MPNLIDSENPLARLINLLVAAVTMPVTLVLLGIAGGSGSRYGSFGEAAADVLRTIGFLIIAPFVLLGFAALWSIDRFVHGQ